MALAAKPAITPAKPLARHLDNNACKGFVDELALSADTPHGGWTWDNKNKLTAGNLVEPDQRIDYVWAVPAKAARNTLRVVDSNIVGSSPPVSDHYAVASTVLLTKTVVL